MSRCQQSRQQIFLLLLLDAKMASGYGLKGNVSKCFTHFQDFVSCMKSSEDPINKCGLLRDDYFECVHNRRLVTRTETIQKQEQLNLQGGGHNVGSHHGGGGGGH